MSVSATGSANALSGYSLLAAPKDTKSSSIEKEFLDYAKMSPIERMRQNILKGMNLTEQALASMSTDQRQQVENQIKDKLKDMLKGGQLGQQAGTGAQAASATAGPSLSSGTLGALLSIQAGN